MIKQKWDLLGHKWKPLLPVTKVWCPPASRAAGGRAVRSMSLSEGAAQLQRSAQFNDKKDAPLKATCAWLQTERTGPVFMLLLV